MRHSSISYKAYIDGIRAYAILFVMIFHIWPHSLHGGFIGVDIFFVISGFLITSIINKELDLGTFTFAKFYTKRIKRIMPVYYVVVFITFISAYFMLLPGIDDFTWY